MLLSAKATTVQVASFGPYRVKVIVPVGLVPKVRCATSFTDPPAATEPLAVVVSAGADRQSVVEGEGSAQGVGRATVLIRSPEWLEMQRWVPSWMGGKEHTV